MRKIFSKIHLWLSIPFGVIIAITCLTGALLVFEKELVEVFDAQVFFRDVRHLHRFLLDAHRHHGSFSFGKFVVDISATAFVFVLISGFVSWVPRNRAALRNRLTVKIHKGWFRFFYDLHVSGGFYMTLLLIVMALTGLTWSFDWYRDAVYSLFSDDMTPREIRRMIHSLHVGSWGGLVTRIFYCVAAFTGGVCAITGYYFWIRRLVRKKG